MRRARTPRRNLLEAEKSIINLRSSSPSADDEDLFSSSHLLLQLLVTVRVLVLLMTPSTVQ